MGCILRIWKDGHCVHNTCKTCENFEFKFFRKKKWCKTVIYLNSPEKSWDFYRSWMMKLIAPLESSREI